MEEYGQLYNKLIEKGKMARNTLTLSVAVSKTSCDHAVVMH
ncbi:hypothetical protein Premu_2145 [Hallella multisaccharivorax DSM 17128]|uniref:Uncharacterized protein n=1 Tax=Hallella multisaccharivorax DSM 17128 TaxID=688246 RepID=F8N7Y9_9BACT|nr:hypothetical protein Premu_2145 [Hallella multisaccharivorax DSM 17128]